MAGKKILVVDDSLTIQKVIRLALSNEGYEIQAASDGNDASQQLALFQPDVALVDVSLPGKSAFELKAESNSSTDSHKPKFVLMSSAFEQVDESKAEEVRFDARLVKPFDPAHLRQVLTDVLSAPSAPATTSAASLSLNSDTALPPPAGLSDDLWAKEGESHSISEQPPMSANAIEMESGDSDIKKLTESTIKMSGLDDFQWSISESGKKKTTVPEMDSPDEPLIPPHEGFSDLGGSNFELTERTRSKLIRQQALENLPLTPPPPNAEPVAPTATSSAPSSAASAQVVPVSNKDIEDAVRKHVAEAIEKMANRMLPELAEKILKQEIHKMLSDQP